MRSSYIVGTALQLAAVVLAQNLSAVAANLELFWSYGRSEPVYPTPEGAGLGDWATAYAQAKALVAQMTNEEKNNITYGYTSTTNGCSGNIPAIERLGFPGICLSDAGNGVRGVDMVNSYPSGVHVGASWNRNLTYSRGQFMGSEFNLKGVNVALGPVVGPLGRIARGGRNWEGFSNDPYLTGALTGETVKGMQEFVIACVKHFIGNEQETDRNPPLLLEGTYNQSVSFNVDDKTMHELYLWPFQDAVKAGAGAVMCSYNRINDSYACQNSKTLNGLLKGELGFQGFVTTDWSAQHSGVGSALSGLDMAMPDSDYWLNGNLSLAVTNGSLAQTRLDDMATRILASWYKYAQLPEPGIGMPYSLLEPHPIVDARNPAAKSTIFQGAVEGQVLVKNVNNALPLKSPKFLSLFGYDGIAQALNTKDNNSWSSWSLGEDDMLTYPNGTAVDSTMLEYIFLSSVDPSTTGPGISLNGTMITGSGSGSNTPSYIDAPYDAFARQAWEDNTFLAWDFVSQDPIVNEASEACIVFINEQASEGWDRPYVASPYADVLVENVAAQCNNTMVVIHNAGVRLVDRWIDNSNITAVIYAHLPGQDSGRALVEVMYGKQSPSGRLPYTVGKNESDYGMLLGPHLPTGDLDLYYPQINVTEGVYIDYKAFIAANITPRYAFGFGLTYTTFSYASLDVSIVSDANTSVQPPGTTVAEGGIASLWDVLVTVNCTVTNTGSVAAAEVAQLYVGIPGGPEKVLRGFQKQTLSEGQAALFQFDLTRRDLSTWDAVSQNWILQEGPYEIYVGRSVLDIQLTASFTI